MDSLHLYFFTYNCACNFIDPDHFSRHFFDALPVTDNSSSTTPPDLIVLSLQEIAPLAYAFLGGSYLTPYFALFAQAVDRATANHYGSQYVNIVTDNSGMTGLMVYARPDMAGHLSSPSIARLGLGVQEMGNKGAVGARLSFSTQESPHPRVGLTFIAAHLAPAESAVARRNADWRSLVEKLMFGGSEHASPRNDENDDESESAALLPGSPSSQNTYRGIFAPANYLFLGGDLNYRTADKLPADNDYLRFPQADAEPASPLHFSQLLKEDQLKREMQQSRCFHGLSEAPIDFPPTYKYHQEAQAAARDPTQADRVPEWKWTSTRWPSWCDRVLFLDAPPGIGKEAKVKVLKYDALPVSPTSDHRPVTLTVSIPFSKVNALDEHETTAPFPTDPDWERRRDVARRKEYFVGCLAYLGLTREGNGLMLASTIGLLGVWFVMRSLFSA
ncbi:Endonuclease/exonuclease/phosphatase [Aspergillus cavernicola]|uniref:Endonuclease/exonuclease/phosphatase n=1 Tax=Aspergillus cavernicola TaxID=176166 RepID=A0ABR4IHY3_9EURO